MMRFSTFFLLLLAVGLQASSQSLIQYPYNPDEDNNQNIGSPDLLGFLSYYGEPFTPEPILLDSVDLLTVIQNMNSTINSLQAQVAALSSTPSSGVYVVKVQLTAGGALQTIPVIVAQDPDGNSLIGSWTFNRDSDYIMTITHNQNRFPINIMTHAENTSAGGYISRHIYIRSTGNNTVVSNLNSFKVTGLRDTLLGVVGNHVYLTFQFPNNNIFID